MAALSLGFGVGAILAVATVAVAAGGIWLYSDLYIQSHQRAVQNAAAQIGRCGYELRQLLPSHHIITAENGRPVALLPDGSLDQVVLLDKKTARPQDTLIGMSEGDISTALARALDVTNFGTESRYPNSSLLSVGGKYFVAGRVAGRGELCPATE